MKSLETLKWITFLMIIIAVSLCFQLWLFKEVARHKREHESIYYQLPTDQELDSMEYNVNIKSLN